MHRMFIRGKIWKLCMAFVFAASLIATPTKGQKTDANHAHSLLVSTQEMSAQAITIKGKVKSITESMLTVVDEEKGEHAIGVDAKTKIMKAGKAASAAEIKVDDSVVITASKGEGDTLQAVTITVT